MDTPTKRCSTCETFKPITEFYKNRSSKDGLQSVCKSCTSLYGKRYYKNNAEKVKQRHREYWPKFIDQHDNYYKERYWSNKESESERKRIDRILRPEVYRQRSIKYRANNSDKIKVNSRIKYTENRDAILQKGREYYANNPEKALIRLERRRARKAVLPDDYSLEQWQIALDYWNHSCVVCQSNHHIELDHWIPLVSPNCPGTVLLNILPLCRPCNRSKGSKLPDNWLRENFPDQRDTIIQRVAEYFQSLSDE